MKTYLYCSVLVKDFDTHYSYISDFGELKPGKYVAVPFGRKNAVRFGLILSCKEYPEDEVPYPLEHTKHILRMATREEFMADAFPDYADWLTEIDLYIKKEEWDKVLEWACEHKDDSDETILWKVISCFALCIGQNMPLAALNLGTFYYNGRILEQDYQEAFELYKIAADAGIKEAISNCGYCFYYGRHQEVDYAEAYRYFSLGALLYNDPVCLYKLGDLFQNGFGVQKNHVYAYQLYDRAYSIVRSSSTDNDCMADIQLRLGRCRLYGAGCEKDINEAHVLLTLALLNFYPRRNKETYIPKTIATLKSLIAEAQQQLDTDSESSDADDTEV